MTKLRWRRSHRKQFLHKVTTDEQRCLRHDLMLLYLLCGWHTGQRVCELSWEALLAHFPGYPAFRAQRACFGAAFTYFFMRDVLGIAELSRGAQSA